MVILGGVMLSLLGIGDRSLDGASGAQIAFFRAVGQFGFFSLLFTIMFRGRLRSELRAFTRRGWLAAMVMSLAGFFLIMSFQFTLVANAVFFISLTPLIAAILAWVFLRERINRRTIISMIIAFIGVGIIFGTNLSGEGAVGMLFAFTMAVCYAGAIVIVRTEPTMNIILVCALNGLLTMIFMIPLMDGFVVTQKDLLICLALGVFQVGFGTFLVMMGARHVPSAQVSILALLEVVLSPLWVWLFVSETPSMTTLIGGAIVLWGVIYQALGAKNSQS